jgi:hypothetical protein
MVAEGRRRVGGLLLAVALLVVPALVPTGGSSFLAVLRIGVAILGPVAALAVAGWTLRDWVSERVSGVLRNLANETIIMSLPPRVVLTTLLRRIYGRTPSHEGVVAGILGGAGLDVHGRDIATSRRTVVEVRLTPIDDKTHELLMHWTHRLSGVLASYKFVVFATCDPEMWNALPSARKVPLYESWFVQGEDFLESFVPQQEQALKLGISYRDVDGNLHRVPPRGLECSQPYVRDWPDYVRLPAGVESNHVRILEFDLGQLVDDEHIVGAIETLSLVAATHEPTADRFLSWTPPYPCFVERIQFEVGDLRLDGEPPLFKIVPFTMERPGPTFTHEWVPAEELRDLVLESWLLPGHGFALLWRPGSEAGGADR